MKITIIDYGAGNIQSVMFAIQRLGYTAELTNDKKKIINADKVIFPGVGEAGTAMKKLRETELDQIIPGLEQPVLGICLGMQLMCNKTEEGNTEGLGIFNTEVKKFQNTVKVPQIGWNQIYDLQSPLFDGVDERAYVYLVHGYYASLTEETIAKTVYGQEYTTALQYNNFFGTQFHPEKSSDTGALILDNFLKL